MSEDPIKKIIGRRKQLENGILKLFYDLTKETGINVGEIQHGLETIKTYTIKVKLEFPE